MLSPSLEPGGFAAALLATKLFSSAPVPKSQALSTSKLRWGVAAMARKRDKERDRVKKIGVEYQSLSEMLGLHPRKQNKVLTLKAALQFIVENYEGMTTLVPGVCEINFTLVHKLSYLIWCL